MKQRIIAISVLLLLVVAMLGCNAALEEMPVESPTQEPTDVPMIPQIVPDEGFGGIVGVIQDFDPSQYTRDVYVWVADFYGNVDEGGFYVLIPEQFPKAKVEANGLFQVNNLKPGTYVMVVGMRAESALPVIEGGTTKVVTVTANELAEIGEVVTE